MRGSSDRRGKTAGHRSGHASRMEMKRNHTNATVGARVYPYVGGDWSKRLYNEAPADLASAKRPILRFKRYNVQMGSHGIDSC